MLQRKRKALRLVAAIGSGAALMAACSSGGSGSASSYPTRQISLVCASTVTSGIASEANEIAKILPKYLKGAHVIIQYQGGANGAQGAQTVASAHPDGYTIGFASAPTFTVHPLTTPQAIKGPQSVKAVSTMFDKAAFLFASRSSGIKTFQDLIAKARANPGKVNVAVSRAYDFFSVAQVLIDQQAGVKVNLVPTGPGQQILDVLNGTAPVGWVDPALAESYVKAGKIVPLLAVAQAPLAGLDAPLATDLGYKGVTPAAVGLYDYLYVPPKTSDAIVNKLSGAIKKMLADPDFVKFATSIHTTPKFQDPATTAKTTQDSFNQMKPLIKLLK